MYERDEQRPIIHFLSIKDILKEYKESEDYQLMSKVEKRRVKEVSFTEDIKKNLLLKKDVVAPMKVSVSVNGQLKRNTRLGLVHWKKKVKDDDSIDDFGETREVSGGWDLSSQFDEE